MQFPLRSRKWLNFVPWIFITSVIIILFILAVLASCNWPTLCIKNWTHQEKTNVTRRLLTDPNPKAQCWFRYGGVCVPEENSCPYSSNLTTNCSTDYKCCTAQPAAVGNLPARRSCGSAYVPPKRFRISNGWQTVAWPWIVSIRRNSIHICGGTVISPSVVLSAAHCFEKWPDVEHNVVTGEYNINGNDNTEVVFNISQVILHQNFSRILGWNDIAILILKRKIRMDFHRQPACLPVPEDNFRHLNVTRNRDADVCFVLGWGKSHTLNIPQLQMATVPLIDQKRCEKMISKIYQYVSHRFHSMLNLCTYFDSDYMITDTCKGDSGGPLFCRRKDKIILTGIVSWGPSICADYEKPGVYTKVLAYIPWIKKNVKDLPQ